MVSIKDLKNTLESKEEAKKKQILETMKDSTFKFVKSGEEWTVQLKYIKNGKANDFDLEGLLELRDRALLMQHTAGYGAKDRSEQLSEAEERKSKEEQQVIGNYVLFSNSIRISLDNLNSL